MKACSMCNMTQGPLVAAEVWEDFELGLGVHVFLASWHFAEPVYSIPLVSEFKNYIQMGEKIFPRLSREVYKIHVSISWHLLCESCHIAIF